VGIVYNKRIESLAKYSITRLTGGLNILIRRTGNMLWESYGKLINGVVVGCVEIADSMTGQQFKRYVAKMSMNAKIKGGGLLTAILRLFIVILKKKEESANGRSLLCKMQGQEGNEER
jgi:hypothetical protein